ncbi:HNH endonuclease signature motif containing protein [Demequina sp. NBRC 110052]|uniref:HNH endonuclease n=1 Tax=Demequina sp. NBRC 110052 TaxID=1570341 RepID=UPI000A04A386|nr:HNH endonuclease signature motif containing protein [Demequina sp. NBRC 110052]
MDLRTADLARALRVLERLDGRESASLRDSEVIELVQAGSLVNCLGEMQLAVGAHEADVRSDPGLGTQGFARRHGQRNAVHLIARLTGLTAGAALKVIEVGRMLAAAARAASEAHTPDAGAGPSQGGGQPSGSPDPDDTPPRDDPPPDDEKPGGAGAGGGPQLSRPAPVRGAAQGVYRRVALATSAGSISVEQASLVTRTLDAVRGLRADLSRARAQGGPGAPTHESAPWTEPDALEARLVRIATTSPIAELRKQCLHARAAADPVAWEARERTHRRDRYLMVKSEEDGAVTLHARMDAASAAPLIAFVDKHVTVGMQSRRGLPAGVDDRSPGAMRLDALLDLARHGLGCESQVSNVTTEVVVRVPQSELESGLGLADCDALMAPVSIASLRRLAVDAAVIPAVLGTEGQVLDLGRRKRLFTRAQRIAIGERDGGCVMCGAPPSWCSTHHIAWWSRGGPTDLSNGVLLCTNCHHRVHDETWDIVPRNGAIYLRPPATIDPARQLRPALRRQEQPSAAAA